MILPKGGMLTRGARKFIYNPELSLAQNLDYATNRTWEKVYAQISSEYLTLEEIYAYAKLFKNLHETQTLEVVALR